MIRTVIPRSVVQLLSAHRSGNLGVVEHSGGHQDPQEKGGYMQKQKDSHYTKQPWPGPGLQSGAEGGVHFGDVVVIVVIGGEHFEWWHTIQFNTFYQLLVSFREVTWIY